MTWLNAKTLIALSSATVILVGATISQNTVQAQTVDPSSLPQLDLPRLAINLGSRTNQSQTSIIDFENVQGPASGAGIELSNQYEQSHGVSFGDGASVHFCGQEFTTVATGLCSLRAAASGSRVAAHEVRTGGPVMGIAISRSVSAVSMRINPTGGVTDETFEARLTGFNEAGNEIANERLRFVWRQDAFTWPNTVSLNANGARLSRVDVSLHSVASNNQAVRFLIDDLTLTYAPDMSDRPVMAALLDERRPPPLDAAPAALPERMEAARDRLRNYPAAQRMRSAIDWDRVEAVMSQQKDMSIAAAPRIIDRAMPVIEMPMLTPRRVDPDSLSLVGGADSYHADFELDGRAYSIYGTRVLTMVDRADGAPDPTENIAVIETDYGLIASFSLFGASYTLTRYCRFDSAAEDPACHDGDALGVVASELVAEIGDAGRRRP